ncbi:MAG: HDIG domain-containing protein [Bacteroidaceae bacterium]|nr:HDIG domain-containing protein [Bacteroidaceae bacterium]
MAAKNNKFRLLLARVPVFLACIVAIIWALPRDNAPKLLYELNHPWTYPDLIADSDFPVFRDSMEIRREKDSLVSLIEPYFTKNREIASEQIARFQADHEKNDHGLTQSMMYSIVRALANVYEKGIIDNARYMKIAADTLHNIRLVEGNQAVPINIMEFYYPRSAYEHLFDSPAMQAYRPAIQNCELQEYLKPNIIYDEQRNKDEINDVENMVSETRQFVQKNSKIVRRGDNITRDIYQKLLSYEIANSQRTHNVASIPSTVAGQTLYVCVMMVLLLIYIYLFRKDYFEKPRLLMLQFLLVTLFPVVVSIMMSHTLYNVYALPYAMVPMFIRVFMDSRTAFISHVVMILICAVAVKYQYEFIIVQIVAGAVAIYSMRHLTKRSELFVAALHVTIFSCLIYFSLQLMQTTKTASELDNNFYKYFCINGVLLLFTYPAMYLIERMFNFTSDVTLIELSNTSNRLLRKLSMVAPGTYQHCTMVSNLAAEISEKIGAQTQLVRTGALYHDIGKMSNPEYYTENQNGMKNPLEKKDRKEAAKIIISHVKEGVRLAKAEGLPQEIIDFIQTHHGTGLTKYFYLNYKNEHPKEEVNPADFSYGGPNPSTAEQAILMMADAVEAASRSLPDYSEKSITGLVNRIIDSQVADRFFENCPINFRDVTAAKQVLIERLMAIYHTRISYPKEK